MNPAARNAFLVALLAFAGVVSHTLPHAMGVSTVGAVGMLAAAYLPRHLTMLPVLLTVLVVDAYNGFYGALAMSFVYLGHLAGAMAVRPVLHTIGVRSVAIASVVSAVVFYLLSNLTPMAMGFYPNTLAGWAACYTNALPFLLNEIVANAIYGGLAFGLIALVGASDARRLFAAKRH
ncbi:MAG: DUF6580 family putative transport protein [Pseudomonadota bacterium]